MAGHSRSNAAKAKAQEILAARRLRDPCYAYQPGPTAQEFHKSNTYHCLVTGGGGSGKSTACLIDLSMCLRGIHPHKPWLGPVRAVVLCVTRQQAAMVAQRKLFHCSELTGPNGEQIPASNEPMIPEREIADYGAVKVGFKTNYVVTLKNGSEVYFMWAEDEKTGERIQGGQYQYIYIDEAAGTPFLLTECLKRVNRMQKPSNGWWGRLVWGATGTKLNEAFETFRANCLDPERTDFQLFQIKRGENPNDSPEALARLAATMTEEQRRIHIAGDATAADLLTIYGKQWSDERHVLATDYVPRACDNLWLGYDPGVEHPTGMLMVAIRPEEPMTLYCVKFWNHARQTLDYDVRCLNEWLLGRRLAGVVYDWAAKAKDKLGSSVLTQLQDRFHSTGIFPYVGFYAASKNHDPGIKKVRHYLDPDPYDKTAAPYIKTNGSAESGCKMLRYQMMAYRSFEPGKFTGLRGVVKKEDEGPDTLRYLVMGKLAYNSAWNCGETTRHQTNSTQAPESLPQPDAPVLKTPYERHLSLSRARDRRKGFVAQSVLW